MGIKDTEQYNNITAYRTSQKGDVERVAHLSDGAQRLLAQIAKIDPNEVEAMCVAVLNKNGEDNLVGLVGELGDIKECATEIVLRIAVAGKQRDIAEAKAVAAEGGK